MRPARLYHLAFFSKGGIEMSAIITLGWGGGGDTGVDIFLCFALDYFSSSFVQMTITAVEKKHMASSFVQCM